ncbi:MAG TPA: hypothetical protein VGT08_07650 [Terracidiphilus sp.]|nr:hypothetical protein [Terracidiphilus sp.]
MKILLCACAALGMALTAVTARAVDITGTWTADMTTPDGNTFQLSFTFKQDGAALTGTVQGPQGDAVAISDGKVEGDKLSFKVSFNGMTISHDGTVSESGDEIKLSTKSDSGDFPAREMTLKRVKAAPVPAGTAAPQSKPQLHEAN